MPPTSPSTSSPLDKGACTVLKQFPRCNHKTRRNEHSTRTVPESGRHNPKNCISIQAVHAMSCDRIRREAERLPHIPVSLALRPDYTPIQILNGRAWVIVDAAVIDVSSFAKRHPGGARLIMNSMGTDVTSEIIGEDASVGNSSMAFDPHPHTDVSSALGSEARVVERGTAIIGGGVGGTLRLLTVFYCIGCVELR